MRLVFLGPPGAGKGTQAKELTKEGYVHISTGDLLREEVSKGTELGKRVKAIMESGELVPDDIVLSLVRAKIEGSEKFILDGFPRTIPQAQALESITELDAVIYFNIDEQTAVDRISLRRSCPKCGRIYHLQYDPPAEDELCDNCKLKLIQRDDDREEVVRRRYRVYLERTAPLIDYYRARGKLVELDAKQPKDKVSTELKVALAKLLR